jgi:hypothetical protein
MLTSGVSIPACDPPAFVQEWSADRAKRAEAKQNRQAQAVETLPDPDARNKRIEKREGRVSAGLDQLETWITDIVSAGLATARSREQAFWSQMASRLVDAQAPGLARRVREIGDLSVSSARWQMDLIVGLARLQLLIDAYRNLDRLPPDLAAEVRTLAGWTQDQDAVRQGQGVRDLWLVLGQHQTQEEQLRTQYTWLRGEQTRQFALLLDFAVGPQPLPAGLTIGQVIDAELAYFQGCPRLRALETLRHGSHPLRTSLPPTSTIAVMQSEHAKLLAMNPWLERYPVLLGPVRPIMEKETLFLRDEDGRWIPVPPGFRHHWNLIALAGNEQLRIFGEWNGITLEPRTIECAGHLFTTARLGDLPILSQVA